jgi:hypothetical protein
VYFLLSFDLIFIGFNDIVLLLFILNGRQNVLIAELLQKEGFSGVQGSHELLDKVIFEIGDLVNDLPCHVVLDPQRLRRSPTSAAFSPFYRVVSQNFQRICQ